jgi:hypothetical protein
MRLALSHKQLEPAAALSSRQNRGLMVKPIILASWFIGLTASAEPAPGARFPQRDALLALNGVPQNPSALGYLNLHNRHPDGAEGPEEFNSAYSRHQALQRLTQNRIVLARDRSNMSSRN